MAHANVDLIKGAYESFAAGDIAALMDIWADDIVWHTAGNNPLAGDHSGKEAVAAYLGGVVQNTGGTFRAELQQVFADDTNGFSLHKGTATSDGVELEAWSVLGYRIRDGKISEIWTFDYDQQISDRILS